MIPVTRQPEPLDFHEKVAVLGESFLTQVSNPTNWKHKEYWQHALNDLYEAYNHICAYSAEWIPRMTGSYCVDHFVPKSVNPRLAYQWSNFRLCCSKMNSRKGVFQDVLDPFLVQRDWFIMRFPSLLVMPNPRLEAPESEKVYSTINRLRLNDDEICVKSRLYWLQLFCENKNLDFLSRHAPFIAYELQRQDLVHQIATMLSV